MKPPKILIQQSGMTLMEIIASLAIIGAVVVGALSLFGNAQSSNNATQLVRDIVSIRSATQTLSLGQNGYGPAGQSLNSTLISGGKVPTTLTVDRIANTINTPIGGRLTVEVDSPDTRRFKITLTAVPRDICTTLVTNMPTGWSSLKIGANTAVTTFPITPIAAAASTGCGAADTSDLIWITTN